MFFLIHFIIIVLIFTLQTTWLDALSFAGVRPGPALILVVYCGFHFRDRYGIGMGVVMGLIQDCLSGGLLGVNTLSKSLVAFFFATLKDKIIIQGVLPTCFFVFAASILDGLIYYLILVTLLKGNVSGGFMLSSVLIFGVYNAVISPFLFYLFDGVRKWVVERFPNYYLGPA